MRVGATVRVRVSLAQLGLRRERSLLEAVGVHLRLDEEPRHLTRLALPLRRHLACGLECCRARLLLLLARHRALHCRLLQRRRAHLCLLGARRQRSVLVGVLLLEREHLQTGRQRARRCGGAAVRRTRAAVQRCRGGCRVEVQSGGAEW
eukprot:scaffold69424_cov65-Phaeocystis_antarctica.AAC.1